MNEKANLPEAFKTKMQSLLKDEYAAFISSLDTSPLTSVRLNPQKPSGAFSGAESIPWCAEGRYLNERPSFTFDPLFHAGAYYVQEASSMFLQEVWKTIHPNHKAIKVLDLCAAPGGKSTHLLSLITNESLLVSNEVIPVRNKILRQNIIKWGNANCIITQNQPVDFKQADNFFDVVLIDAPCSGEGLFRKDKDAISEWSEQNVAMCSVRQRDILESAVACLQPGGYLIYSTCTFEPEENDDNIEWLLTQDFELITISTSLFPGIVKTRHGYQFYPHRIKGEGFYISVLQKQGAPDAATSATSKHKSTRGNNTGLLQTYLSEPEKFIDIIRNDIRFALPATIAEDFIYLEKKLYIRCAGIEMGEMKGQDFLPSAALALSTGIKPDLRVRELSYDEAISYLRCEGPQIKSTEKGWYLARYRGLNLGWMKFLGNRVNNYYPKEWRILKR